MEKEDLKKVYQELIDQIDIEKAMRDYLVYGEVFVNIEEFDVEGFIISNKSW